MKDDTRAAFVRIYRSEATKLLELAQEVSRWGELLPPLSEEEPVPGTLERVAREIDEAVGHLITGADAFRSAAEMLEGGFERMDRPMDLLREMVIAELEKRKEVLKE